MGMVVPKVRKHLCADALLRSIQDVFSHIPDHRKGDAEIPLGDALMSAFAMFSLKSPSLLAFDKVRAEDNLQSIYGIGRVPCDTSMREILDPVEPEHVRPAFKMVCRHLQRGKALEEMVFVEGHYPSPFNIVIAGRAARTSTHDRHSRIQCLEAVLL